MKHGIILLGPPGSGKGTQAELIIKELNIPPISTGNILRHTMEQKTALAQELKGYIEKGKLVPDELIDRIVAERLVHKDCKSGFLLDGFPRDLVQAKFVNTIIEVTHVIDLKVPDKFIIQRLAIRKRADDKPEVIKNRLNVYHRLTEPLIKYYKRQGILHEVDGVGTVKDIHRRIMKELKVDLRSPKKEYGFRFLYPLRNC
ncbi:TPA: adenylate kinase [Candidatus Woesearchaeota archaeon]|nr:adenylate kinase [Candidatus Woesearchaeota archaeon]